MQMDTLTGLNDSAGKSRRPENLEEFFALFPSLPREAILKQDILREGLSFSGDSLRVASGYKPKDYFIFSFDLVPIKDMNQEEHLRAPEEIKIGRAHV